MRERERKGERGRKGEGEVLQRERKIVIINYHFLIMKIIRVKV